MDATRRALVAMEQAFTRYPGNDDERHHALTLAHAVLSIPEANTEEAKLWVLSTKLATSLRECLAEMQAMHSLYCPECKGGCPNDMAERSATPRLFEYDAYASQRGDNNA